MKCIGGLRRLLAALLAFAALVVPAAAHEIALTIYDDGQSCPGDCDAHVVLNKAENGTEHAHGLDSTAAAPERCRVGEPCRICFGHTENSCMTAIYRGAGPPRGKFDFTPAFYAAECGAEGIPAALAAQCAALDRRVHQLGYDDRISCFDAADDPQCAGRIAAARAARQADLPDWEDCRRVGEPAFNAAQPGDARRRSNACAYSKLKLGGPNSAGTRWRVLLPAACRSGTYVGRDGLDCCSADRRFAASVHPECAGFFPKP